MKSIKAIIVQFVLILCQQNLNVESAVGLFGPDRYEGLPEICLMPMEFGYCRAKVQRYYFDIRRMKCTMFFYGGCAGNDNNFKTMEECSQYCQAIYDDSINSVVVSKRQRFDASLNNNNNARNSKFNNLESRGSSSSSSSSISKSSTKFNVKSNPAPVKEPSFNNTNRGQSAKSFNNPSTARPYKIATTNTETIDEDGEYDDE